MEKMFVSLENSLSETNQSIYDGPEPMRSKAAIASYRCKLYRTHLEQRAASHIAPHFSTDSKNTVPQPRA